MGLVIRLKKVFATLFLLNNLILKEAKCPHRIPFRERLKAWYRGFLSKSFILYNLEENDYRKYLSDFQRYIRTPYINDKYSIVLNNKFIFHSVLSRYKEHLPKIFFFLKDGKIFHIDNSLTDDKIQSIDNLFEKKVDFVIKPIDGGGGKNIYIIKNQNNSIFLNGNEVKASYIKTMCNELNNYILTEYVNQANYARTIFQSSVNTIRILTMWDVKNNKPFIAEAIHRFGVKKSIPVDNWTGGGLSVSIDIDNGVLGRAVCFSQDNKLKWLNRHPDTDSAISGIKIPGWEEVKRKLLNIAYSLPMIPYIGWDILIQDNNFKIIEANNYSGVDPLQVHRPLLLDKRIIEFYRHYNVIK